MDLSWWLSWLDSGALINVDAPECGMSVVSRPDRAQVGRFSSCTYRFPLQKCLLLIAYKLCHILIKEAILI